jgi:nitrite reductase/ring-hydroxylating ferredoxin subunit
MSWNHLISAHSLPSYSAKEFILESVQRPVNIFVININNNYFAYINRCPHTGVTLNWQPDQFFDIDNHFVQCSTHGAIFRFDDGYCVRGPCAGAKLSKLPLKIEDNDIYVKYDSIEQK